MYLQHLLVKNCKLMKHLEVSFVREDKSIRLWTVFVGENGSCKTTLLRTIALATAGSAFANNLVNDPSAYVDRRGELSAVVDACFGFSTRFHGGRVYPTMNPKGGAPPEVVSRTEVGPTSVTFRANYGEWAARAEAIDAPRRAVAAVAADYAGRAALAAAEAASATDDAQAARWAEEAARFAAGAAAASQTTWSNPIDDARSQGLSLWFAAGYGVGRTLSEPQSATEGSVPQRDRLRSLFDVRHLPLGTGFSDRLAVMFGDERARAFAKCLEEALVERMQLPKLRKIELRGHRGANNQRTLIEAHRFGMQVGNEELKLPAIWLSQGYQAVISLVADIIGNVWLESGAEVALDDMEGIVLVDELDLHLHPTWQTQVVQGLKATFPSMQFIVTTHSPLVLAGCRPDEVWVLKQDDQTGDITTSPKDDVVPMLLTGSELNREYFGVNRASQLSDDMRRYLEVASDRFRSDADDELATRLLEKLRQNDVLVEYEPVARESSS